MELLQTAKVHRVALRRIQFRYKTAPKAAPVHSMPTVLDQVSLSFSFAESQDADPRAALLLLNSGQFCFAGFPMIAAMIPPSLKVVRGRETTKLDLVYWRVLVARTYCL